MIGAALFQIKDILLAVVKESALGKIDTGVEGALIMNTALTVAAAVVATLVEASVESVIVAAVEDLSHLTKV
jgi:hypothetical protein